MIVLVILQLIQLVQAANVKPIRPGNPQKPLTVCEVLANLQKYRDKVIQVRGQWNGTNVYGRGCAAPRTGEYVWEPAIWLKWDNDQQAQDAGAKAKAVMSRKAHFVDATFIGRLEARAEGLQTGRGGTPGTVVGNGFGHLARFPAQLLVADVKDVAPGKE